MVLTILIAPLMLHEPLFLKKRCKSFRCLLIALPLSLVARSAALSILLPVVVPINFMVSVLVLSDKNRFKRVMPSALLPMAKNLLLRGRNMVLLLVAQLFTARLISLWR